MEPNEVPPPQPGKTWVIRNNADYVQYMCTMCQITPAQFYARLKAIEEFEKPNQAIAAGVMARHNAVIVKKEKEDYHTWLGKKAKQNKRIRR